MTRRAILLAFCIGAAAGAGEPVDLRNPKKSVRARTLLKKAQESWAAALPVWEKVKAEEAATAEEIDAAVEAVAEAVEAMEDSLRLEWNNEANTALAEAARAWYGLRAKRPPATEPVEEEARAKAEAAAAKERKERLRRLRGFLMEYGRLRRHDKQVRRCPRCDGHKVLRSAFGDSHDCPTCKRKGFLLDPEGVLDAKWFIYSPLFRANARKQQQMNRLLSVARENASRLAPFVRSIAIDGDPEDHGDWVRIPVKEKTYPEPGSKRIETVETVYTLFRVGEVWYFYERSFDRDLLEIPELKQD